jgi:hypothetical protein
MDWIAAEVDWREQVDDAEVVLSRGSRGEAVARIQEHLTLHGHATTVDGIFGPATEAAVTAFRGDGMGEVAQEVWRAFVAPLKSVLIHERRVSFSWPDAISDLTKAHLYAGDRMYGPPREVGEIPNSGPWVRLYMNGSDQRTARSNRPWCAGFVSFIVAQAGIMTAAGTPFPYTWSCDMLAQYAQEDSLFVAGGDPAAYEDLRDTGEPALFLLRRTANDWVHAGIVTEWGPDYVRTVEGNTNHAGAREGTHVRERYRSLDRLDFVAICSQ